MKANAFHKAGKRVLSLAFALAVGMTAIYVAIPRAPAHAAPIGADEYLYSISFSTADIFAHKDSEGQTHAGLYYTLDAGAFMPVPGSEYYNNEIPQYTDFEVFDVYLSEDGLDYCPESPEQWIQVSEPLTGETFFALETAVSFQVNSAPTFAEVTVNPADGHKTVKASFKSSSNSLFAFVGFATACGDYVLGYSFRVNGIPGSLISGSGGGYTEEDLNDKYNEGVQAGRTEGYDNGYSAGYETGKQDGANETYDSAFAQGQAQGHTAGYTEGHAEGYTEGKTDGYSEGKTDGYQEGHTEGYQEGQSNALTQFVANGATEYAGKMKPNKYADPKTGDGTAWSYVSINAKLSDFDFADWYFSKEGNLLSYRPNDFGVGDSYTITSATFECFVVGFDIHRRYMSYSAPGYGSRSFTATAYAVSPGSSSYGVEWTVDAPATSVVETFITNAELVGQEFCVVYKGKTADNTEVYVSGSLIITADMLTEINAPFTYAPSGKPFDTMYNNGYSAGYDAADAPAKMAGFLPGIFGGVTKFFAETLGGMTIFGISALDVFLTFVMIALVSFVIRFVK